jgi:DNA-binding transcriptional ArsR family regulator
MTYRELRDKLQHVSVKQLDDDISVYFRTLDEYYEVSHLSIEQHSDALDKGHLVLVLKGGL